MISVILMHGQSGLLAGGFLGVEVFFALSGFLITSLLIREAKASGRINFAHFYFRRALRIFPAFGLLLVIFCGYAIWGGLRSSTLTAEILPSALYLSNWTRAFDLGYPVYLGHTWSLAIEEQFYLLWPAIFALLLAMRPDARACAAIVIAMIVAVIAWRLSLAMLGQSPMRLYNGFDTRSDGLLIGAAAACVADVPDAAGRIRLAQKAAKLLPAAVAAVVLMLFFAEWDHPAMYLLGYSVTAFATALAIFVIAEGEGDWLRRLLEWRPLVETGRISYGLYLWHYVIFTIMLVDLGLDPWPVNTAGIGLSLAAALLSHQLIERPVLRLKTRFATV